MNILKEYAKIAWDLITKRWDTETTEGRVKMVVVGVIVVVVVLSTFFGK